MPLPGGETDKIGNRYEGRWTVFCMADVMDEKADSIRLEKPGEDAFEFFLRRNGKLEYHQVKRQKSGRGRWTLSALEDKQVQVLSDFWKKLQAPDVSCVFVSTQDADELGELANRARDAASWTEFEHDFLNKTLFGHFKTLCQKWGNCSQMDAFEALKRVRVETVGEKFLVDTIENRLAALVEGDPKTIRIELAELAQDRIHHELTAHDIWHYLLQERGDRRRQWGNDPHVLAAVENANNLYISSLREQRAIAGDIIPRDEAQIAFEQLTEKKQSILLVGEAGVGKSGVMLQVLEKLHNQGFPILAFRVDSLAPIPLPDNVGQQLGLPGSPAIVLANIAQKRDCVLVIDQLDAVSLASGRNPEFFTCVDLIIQQAQAHPNIRVLLACRKFDLENDYRIKKLLSSENAIALAVTINRLAHLTVRETVTKLSLDATRLSEKQIHLLSVPLHLSLLAEIAKDSSIDVLNFQTAKELYDQFWKYKKSKLLERLGRSVQWTQVIDALCDYMNGQQQQSLSAPERVVDEFADDANAMASEHILTWEGKRISFFHETFFDYAFARRFAARGQKLLPFLGRREQQHLFRRAQVRQILLHEREEDFDQYLANLEALLTSSEIRFHIKQVVFALLGTIDKPKQEEWEIIAPLIAKGDAALSQQVWRTLYGSVSWFQLLNSLGIIQQWLRDKNEELVDKTITLLSRMQSQIPDQVAELVEPFVGLSNVWRNRLVYLIQWSQLETGRRFFELFLRLIDEGILDEARGAIAVSNDFWSLIYSLPEKRPEWACEVIGHYLNRHLSLSLATGQSNPFDRHQGTIPDSQYDDRIFIESARRAPREFVDQVLPFILRLLELTARKEGDPPWKDSIWWFRSYGRDYGINYALLNGIEAALCSLAANYPEDFATLAQQQLRQSNFETIQYLLVRAYTANPERFASVAIDYLCEQPARLKTGYSAGAGNVHAAPFWATRQLLEATTPYCSPEKLVQLEKVILNYYTNYEKSSDGLWFRGYPQLILLDAIAQNRMTQAGIRRLQELKRKFTDLELLEPPGKIEPPESVEARIVGSPIPDQAADKMTDEQWLQAIARYDYDDLGTRFQRTGELIGGAHQLSSLLESQVKKQPARFASLIWRFPDNANSSYFDAVLRGIAEVGLDVETAFRVCQRCHQLPQRPCGRWIAWLFEKLANLPWTVSALDILLCYALNDPDPKQELWRTPTSNGSVYYGGDIREAGINSTRGSAVSAIAKLIFADKNRASYLLIPMQQIVRDSSIAVRSCAAEALTAMLNYDRDLAVNLFHELCKTEDVLLATHTVEKFLKYTLPTHFQQLAPILERMITSDLPEVVKVGARQACLASLIIVEARSLGERCLTGTESHRISAARISVANLRTAHFREFCETGLTQLFNDSDKNVRKQAAKCFFRFEGEELGAYVNLVEAFVKSLAFETDCSHLISALQKTTAKLPDITYLVCEKFIDSCGSSAADIRTRSAADANEVSELLIRLYSQSKDETLRSRCLDLVDRMMQMETYGLDKALQEFER
ncbi:hypothetical protein NUACC21_60470 [Scytonema sp. NUACC21]